MSSLPILLFEPILKSVVWGGRGLETLGKKLPSQEPYGESWELVDLDGNQSMVLSGTYRCNTVEQLIKENFESFMGDAKLLDGRFPLLFKFIDAQDRLSVQVHPDENACEVLGNARPKTEAWYIVDCEKDAKLYVGLKHPVSKEVFKDALENGTVDELLHVKSVKPGDFVYLPAGTIHAIGKGVLLAEVQQSSNTTYRVFDWDRVGLDGNPRQLHIDEALESIHFNESKEPDISPPTSGLEGAVSPYFSMEIVSANRGDVAQFSSKGPIVIMGTRGEGTCIVNATHNSIELKLGQTIVIPACIAETVTLLSQNLECLVTKIC